MTIDDKEEFAKLMCLWAEVYNRELSEEQIGSYFQDLQNIPLHVIADASTAHRKNERLGFRFPLPADILRECRTMGDAQRLQRDKESMQALLAKPDYRTIGDMTPLERKVIYQRESAKDCKVAHCPICKEQFVLIEKVFAGNYIPQETQ